ncbi:P-type DNA transfer ATPase VirB11 [Sphingomonas sp. Leaf4]|uniref:P-type DNA transfer ATPase VirB11 n=1 Tax=Sphingomonas sp. Leaf4 TaxID=2876553 RepID=UPI001E59BE9C|nr:P-type DNA transfer ATPase VirB11 [Sphingomonas sp. Leaf4]
MTSAVAPTYLDLFLAPLAEQLARPDVTDIYVNEPGVLWVEALGGRIERQAIPDLTEARLWRLAQQIGSATCQGISREHPLLAARLPGGERVQVVAPPATRSGVVLAIRKYVADDLSLLDLEQQGIFASTTGSAVVNPHEARLAALYDAGQWRAFLQTAVRARRTILISGGTSTGKTTILNALIREIDPAERLVFLEDTPELALRHPNAIGLVAPRDALAEASVTTEDLLVASLRLRPDRIILGELRGPEAFTFLRAVNTGHPGSLTTIHADSPAGAIEQLTLLTLQTAQSLRREEIRSYIESVVDIVIQLKRTGNNRVIEQVSWRRHHTHTYRESES